MPNTDISRKARGYNDRILQWRRVRDVMEGEDRIKQRGVRYLPRPEAMSSPQYDRYKRRANFYGVAERTVRGLVGLVFRVQPIFELPGELEGFEQAVTPDGMPLSTLTADILRDVVSLGRYGLLVDMPRGENLIGTAPYIAPYTAENIWRWEERFEPEKGTRRLIRVVVREDPATEGNEQRTYLRELFIDPQTGNYTQQFWVEVMRDSTATTQTASPLEDESILSSGAFELVGPPVVPVVAGQPLKEIPFTFVNTFNLIPKPDRPPLLDLANMNLAHYRNSADLEHALYLTSQPTPVVTGFTNESQKPFAIGSGSVWFLPQGADAKYLEFTGAGIEALQKAMDDKEGRMATLGARLIRDHERSNITAETTKMQMTAETSVLISAVENTERALEKVLRLAAEWAGSSADAVEVSLNRDLVDASLTAQDLDALVKTWQAGAISGRTLHANLQRGEIVDPAKSYDDERAEIDEEGPPPVALAAPGAPPGTPAAEEPEEPEEGDETEE